MVGFKGFALKQFLILGKHFLDKILGCSHTIQMAELTASELRLIS